MIGEGAELRVAERCRTKVSDDRESRYPLPPRAPHAHQRLRRRQCKDIAVLGSVAKPYSSEELPTDGRVSRCGAREESRPFNVRCGSLTVFCESSNAASQDAASSGPEGARG